MKLINLIGIIGLSLFLVACTSQIEQPTSPTIQQESSPYHLIVTYPNGSNLSMNLTESNQLSNETFVSNEYFVTSLEGEYIVWYYDNNIIIKKEEFKIEFPVELSEPQTETATDTVKGAS